MKWSTVTAVVFLCGFLGYTDSQENLPTANEVLEKVSSVVDIPELNNLNTSMIPSVQEAKNLFKQQCEKNGGPNAFENAYNAQQDMERCFKSLVNITQLQIEMERSKPTGDLDLVFKHYCRKSPTLKKCVYNFTTALEPCLEERERESKKIIQNITDSLLSFVCFKEGDRIALFISAGGPECIQSKQQGIQDCVNATFGSYMPAMDPQSGALPGLESLPSLVFGVKECNDISLLQACIVKELEKCADPTPANIVDSIFNFILRVTPCKDVLHQSALAGVDGRSSAMQVVSVLSTASIALLLLQLL